MSVLNIDLNKLIKVGINLDSYLLLYCLNINNKDLINNYVNNCGKLSTENIDFLVEMDYILNNGKIGDKYSFENLSLSNKSINLFFNNVDNWIQLWFDLWPKGVKSGGYLIKADMISCLKKMKKFIEINPQYSKGIIITATKKYLSDMKKDNYAYCKLASYFINKDGNSVLSGLCEQLYDSITNGKDEVGEYKEERL